MYGLLDRIAAPYRRDARRDARASLPAYQRGVMLSQPQSYQSLLGVPTMPAPITPAAPSSSEAMLSYLQTPQVAERLERQRQEDDSSMRRRLGLLQDTPSPEPRPSMPQDTLLGRLGGRVRSATQEIGGLFEGDEGRARAAALSRSLLRGPSRTPISFGQSLAEGLAAGGEEIERMKQRKFAKEQRKTKVSEMKAKQNFVAVMSNPNATDEEQDAALKKAYPLEWSKAKNKKVTVSQMKADAVAKVSDGMKEGKELSDFPQVTQDLYKSAVSAGGASDSLEALLTEVFGDRIKNKETQTSPKLNKNNLPVGTVVKSGGVEYEVQGDGTVKPISR